MNAKDLIQSLVSNLERESQFEDKEVSAKIEAYDNLAIGTVSHIVDGKVEIFQVLARPIGTFDGIKF